MKITLIIAVVASSLGAAHGVNLLSNPGFELGTGGNADAWEELGGAAANGSTLRSTTMANSGAASAYMSIDNLNNAPAGGAFFFQQILPAGSIDPNINYNFSFAGKVDSLDFTGVDIFYQLQWLDLDGSDGGGFISQVQNSVIGSIGTDFSEISIMDVDVPAAADGVLVRFQLSGGAVSGIQQGFTVDDVSLEAVAVPEPSSLGLLALGGLLIVRRRR